MGLADIAGIILARAFYVSLLMALQGTVLIHFVMSAELPKADSVTWQQPNRRPYALGSL